MGTKFFDPSTSTKGMAMNVGSLCASPRFNWSTDINLIPLDFLILAWKTVGADLAITKHLAKG